MGRYKTGMLVRSKAGHDFGMVYVIIDSDESYVYLVDGEIRTLDRPKKKKKKHTQLICNEYDISSANDATIRKIIKEWKKEVEL